MKTCEETFAAVLKRRDAYRKEQKEKRKQARRIAIPAVCCLAAAAIVLGVRSALPKNGPAVIPAPQSAPKDQNPGAEYSAVSYETQVTGGEAVPSLAAGTVVSEVIPSNAGAAVSIPEPEPAPQPAPEPAEKTQPAPPEASVPSSIPVPASAENASEGSPVPSTKAGGSSTVPQPENSDEGIQSGGMYFNIPVLPENREIAVVGERITDGEAAAYFAENGAAIKNALSASGVPTDSIRIAEKGYSHVCYTGEAGERLEARVNFRDYPVYNGETLTAIVTLYKENGTIYNTPACGAAWFADYGAFLAAHRGEELVYVYAGNAEIVLLPDGGMYSPLSGIVPEYYMAGTDDPYALFYCPDAVYVP